MKCHISYIGYLVRSVEAFWSLWGWLADLRWRLILPTLPVPCHPVRRHCSSCLPKSLVEFRRWRKEGVDRSLTLKGSHQWKPASFLCKFVSIQYSLIIFLPWMESWPSLAPLCWERSFGSFLQEFWAQHGRELLAQGIFFLVFLISPDAVECWLWLVYCLLGVSWHPWGEYARVQRAEGNEEHL